MAHVRLQFSRQHAAVAALLQFAGKMTPCHWQTLVVPQRFSMRLLRAVDAGLSAGELARRLHAPPGLSWWDSAPRPRRAAARSAARGLLKAS